MMPPPSPWRFAVPRQIGAIPLVNPYGLGRSRGFSGLSGLGQITAQQAADQAMPESSISSTAGFTQAVWNDIEQAASTGTFVDFNPGNVTCTGVSAGGNIKIIQQGAGLALSGVSMGLTAAGVVAASALAPFTLGISALIGLLPLFFAHHKAAVAKENQTICALVPAAQNYFEQIVAAVNTGIQTPAQGIAALQSLLSDFTSNIASIMKNSASSCNAACVWVKQLTAMCAYQTAQFQEQASSTTGSVTSAISSVTSLPPVVIWAGLGLLVWYLI